MKVDFNKLTMNLRNRMYRYIGSGSGRHVYDLSNGYVVKAAKNKKGIAQNKAEYEIASESRSRLFANIAQVSDDFSLLIMEKAEPVRSMSEVWNYLQVRNNSELYRLTGLKELSTKYDLVFQDLCRPTSWGKINGRYVIIDYGFTHSVRRRYYSIL